MIDEAFGRGSDESTQFGLQLFRRLGLQLLVATPLQKISVIAPFVDSAGYVSSDETRSRLRQIPIEEFRAGREQARRNRAGRVAQPGAAEGDSDLEERP